MHLFYADLQFPTREILREGNFPGEIFIEGEFSRVNAPRGRILLWGKFSEEEFSVSEFSVGEYSGEDSFTRAVHYITFTTTDITKYS